MWGMGGGALWYRLGEGRVRRRRDVEYVGDGGRGFVV